MLRSQLKVPGMVLLPSTTFSGSDDTSPLSLCTWMQGHVEVLSPPQWIPLKMACLSALVPLWSSNNSDVGCALIKVRISLILGGSQIVSWQSFSNSAHELSHTRISRVLSSMFCTEHAAGYASTSNCVMDNLTCIPTAIYRGVPCKQLPWLRDLGDTASKSWMMYARGSYRMHWWRLKVQQMGEGRQMTMIMR